LLSAWYCQSPICRAQNVNTRLLTCARRDCRSMVSHGATRARDHKLIGYSSQWTAAVEVTSKRIRAQGVAFRFNVPSFRRGAHPGAKKGVGIVQSMDLLIAEGLQRTSAGHPADWSARRAYFHRVPGGLARLTESQAFGEFAGTSFATIAATSTRFGTPGVCHWAPTRQQTLAR